ncbi:C6 finger domain protein [Blumeria hordei DH14]|uniref:C6 finger domain protein n=1 Tax=Blumeria graminis f. sp. hordei (strain DH14) TaxID=546991 RepID=N1J8F1_BLUG1|nr:C6 finger domain protein [Blumeria hordei DH14]
MSRHPLSAPEIDSKNLFTCFHQPSDLAQSSLSAQTGEASETILKSQILKPKPTKVGKSIQTSNSRHNTTGQAAPIEKKRNKLGYHRTSVACVDQQSPKVLGRRGAKVSAATERATSRVSLPTTISGQVIDMSAILTYPAHLGIVPATTATSSQKKSQRTGENFTPRVNEAVNSTLELGYNTETSNTGIGNNYWLPTGVPEHTEEVDPYLLANSLVPSYPQFTPGLQSNLLTDWPPAHSEVHSRENPTWSLPTKLTPFSSLQGAIHYPYDNNSYGFYNPDYAQNICTHQATNSTDFYSALTPTVSMPIAASESTLASFTDRQLPQVSNILPPVPISTWEQPYAFQQLSAPSPGLFEGWNGEPNGRIPLEEESSRQDFTAYVQNKSGSDLFYPTRKER